MPKRNPAADFLGAVTTAFMDYEPEEDEDFTGRLVAIQCDDAEEAAEEVESLLSVGFVADSFEHDGKRYARITDLGGTDPNDAIFELGWHNRNGGSIPDTSPATPEGTTP